MGRASGGARSARLRPLLPSGGRRRLGQRARARDRPRARNDRWTARSSSNPSLGGRSHGSCSAPRRRRWQPRRSPSAFPRENGQTAAPLQCYAMRHRPCRRRARCCSARRDGRACSSARLAGWIGEGEGVRTVVVETAPAETGAVDGAVAAARKRLRSGADLRQPLGGVVTIYSFFSERPALAGLRASSSRTTATCSRTRMSSRMPARAQTYGLPPASTSSLPTATAIPGDDRRLGPVRRHRRSSRSIRAITRSRRCRSATRAASSSASPVAAIGSPFGAGELARGGRRLGDRALDRSRSPPPTTSPARSRSTRRSTTATPVGRCSTPAAA